MSTYQIPSYTNSLWLTKEKTPSFPKLKEDIEVDVVIIGAGVTGMTAAYLLSQQGVKVALVEADQLLNGTTGYTTAKVSSQHGAIYHTLLNQVGEEKARLYYEANEAALAFIKDTVDKEKLDVELETKDAFIYATSDQYTNLINKEADAYQQLGIKGILEEGDVGLPFNVKKSLRMQNQAQFHPVKFFSGLIPSILEYGGLIYEDTRIEEITSKDQPTAITTDGYSIKSNHCIVSSHFPFNDKTGLYFSRLHAQRSYCMAVQTDTALPEGMSLNIEPNGTSLRTATGPEGEPLLLIGGAGHKTGQKESQFDSYEELKQFGDEWFGVKTIPYRWSSQDLMTLDSIPYIGQNVSGEERVYVATGFGKWGMTNGVAAALLLRDLVLNKENPYTSLFDPMRSKLKKTDITSFIKENTNVAKEFVKGIVHNSNKELKDLSKDEGAIIQYKGKQTGAYRDSKGTAHLVSVTCTHMGCTLNWNDAERTWDCPCHGGRFSYKGDVIEGPPTKALDRIE